MLSQASFLESCYLYNPSLTKHMYGKHLTSILTRLIGTNWRITGDERVLHGKQAVSLLPHSQGSITHNSLLKGNQIKVLCEVTMDEGLWE